MKKSWMIGVMFLGALTDSPSTMENYPGSGL